MHVCMSSDPLRLGWPTAGKAPPQWWEACTVHARCWCPKSSVALLIVCSTNSSSSLVPGCNAMVSGDGVVGCALVASARASPPGGLGHIDGEDDDAEATVLTRCRAPRTPASESGVRGRSEARRSWAKREPLLLLLILNRDALASDDSTSCSFRHLLAAAVWMRLAAARSAAREH
jgi:hypothetical protein